MDAYMILILLIYAAVMIGMTLHGKRKGFVRLISEAVSLLVSVWTMTMLSSVYVSWQDGDTGGFWSGILFLAVLGILYKILHRILSSIRFIAGLPILSWIDTLLGLLLGFCEGFAILYAVEYLLRLYLLQ